MHYSVFIGLLLVLWEDTLGSFLLLMLLLIISSVSIACTVSVCVGVHGESRELYLRKCFRDEEL